MKVSAAALRLAEEHQNALFRITPRRLKKVQRWHELSKREQTILGAAMDQLIYLGEKEAARGD